MYVIYYEYICELPKKWSSGPSRFKRNVDTLEEARQVKRELEMSPNVQKVSIHKVK